MPKHHVLCELYEQCMAGPKAARAAASCPRKVQEFLSIYRISRRCCQGRLVHTGQKGSCHPDARTYFCPSGKHVPRYELSRCLGEISGVEFEQLISAVKNRILDFCLKIEAENPDASEALPNTQPVPTEKLRPLVQNLFYGTVGNIAQNSERFSQTVSIGIQTEDLARLVTEFTNHLDERPVVLPRSSRLVRPTLLSCRRHRPVSPLE
jgi:hypothetical protein